MISKKYLNIFFLCVTIILVIVIQVYSSADELCGYHPEAYQELELPKLSQELENTGLIGRVHGASASSKLFVMSVREPENFFNYREFSLLPQDKETLDTLNQVKRHDRVCIQGNFITNSSPQKHIAVQSIKVLESWSGREGFPEYERTVNLPSELLDRTDFVGKVHAIGEEGKILVVEYKDGVIPLFVQATEYTQNLYRGDIIKLSYQLQRRPQNPTHLRLNTEVEKPIEVIDAIADWNGIEKTLTGNLVKFNQSPQLKFDVYAIEVETEGIKRYFTLVNFEDLDEFQNIRNKLAQIWDDNLKTVKSGRNMLINPEVRIEAHGMTNIVSPDQANPQILLNNSEDIQQKLT